MHKLWLVLIVLVATSFVVLQVSAADEEVKPWNLRCDPANEQQDKQCEIFQRLDMKETGQRLTEFVVTKIKGEKNPRAIIILPLGVLVEPGALLSVDDKNEMKMSVRYCVPQGCFAFMDLQKGDIKALRKGKEAKLIFVAQNLQKVSVPFTLEGFNKAYKEL